MATLPRDVLIDIFLRFSVKKLVLFSCVCKSWRNVITDPLFIRDHLNRTHKENSCHRRQKLMVLDIYVELGPIGKYLRDSNYYSHSYTRDDLFEYLDYRYQDMRDFCLKTEPSFTCHRVFNSCNGLILVMFGKVSPVLSELMLFVSNPTTRTFIPLPTFHGFLENFSGLGFDSISTDYKVVTFSGEQEGRVVKIYSLNKNLWKDISVSAQFPDRLDKNSKTPVLLNECLHWIGLSKAIVRFDVSLEIFDIISSPPINKCYVYNRGISIAALFEKLCYVDAIRDKCCIWMMNKYGVKESWRIQYVLTVPICGSWSLQISNILGSWSKDVIILETTEGRFVSYDPKNDRLKVLEIRNDLYRRSYEKGDNFCVNNFVESLALFGFKQRDNNSIAT